MMEQPKQNKQAGYYYVLASAIGFGAIAIFVKKAYVFGADKYQLLALRFIFAALILAVFNYFRSGRQVRITPKGHVAVLCQGFGYTLASICYFGALQYVSAATTAMLLYTYPIMVNILAWMVFKESFDKHKAVSLLLTSAGLMLVLKLYEAGNGDLHIVGIVLGLCGAFAYAVFNLIGQKTVSRYPALMVTQYVTVYCAIIFLIIGRPWEIFSLSQWPGIVGYSIALAFVSTFLAIVFYLRGVELLGASKAAVISTFEPVVTVLLAVLFLGETFEVPQLLGGALILGGVFLINRSGKGNKAVQEETCHSATLLHPKEEVLVNKVEG